MRLMLPLVMAWQVVMQVLGVGGGLGACLFCLCWEGAWGGWWWMGGHSGNSDNEGGRAVCEHPGRGGG